MDLAERYQEIRKKLYDAECDLAKAEKNGNTTAMSDAVRRIKLYELEKKEAYEEYIRS